jgi:hypothetical protein
MASSMEKERSNLGKIAERKSWLDLFIKTREAS